MSSRRSLTYVEIDIDYCSLTYSVGPCTASIPTTGDIKCFNCLATCQDTANFTDDGATLRFAINADYLPDDIDCIPCIQSIDFTPAIVSLGGDLGQRASLKVAFKDRPHSDTGAGFDKYLADRDYDPFTQGSLFGKFRVRHIYLQGRDIRVIRGLLGDALADMETRHYVIESFDGPSYDGLYTITAKDVLKLADGDRAQAPALSNGELSAAITDVESSATLAPTGIGESEYPISGYVNIGGKEIVAFTRPITGGIDGSLCKACFHLDGTDTSTTFTDSSGFAHTLTAVGNAQLDTAQFQFGTASLLLDGTGDYATLDGSADFAFGTGEWRISMRVRLNTTGAQKILYDGRTVVGTVAPVILISAGNVFEYATTNGASLSVRCLGTTVLTTGVWYDVTVSKVGSSTKMFVNGTQEGSTYSDSHNYANPASRPVIGADGTSAGATPHNGWIDELYIASGTGSGVSANFTPRTSAFDSSRSDLMTLTRAQFNTEASAHEIGDRVQLCVRYDAEDWADVISDLLQTYASVPASYINLPAWQAETLNFLGTLVTATIAEPTSVADLLSELIDLGPLALWWDDRSQLIRLQVLRQIATDADRFTADNRIEDTLEVAEQAEKRLTQVWTYFAQIDPLLNLDQLENYRAIAKTTDTEAEANYGVPSIRKRFTRWIPEGGSTIATTSNEVLLARYRTPPRRINFSLFRKYLTTQDPVLGGGYQLEAWNFQDATGALEDVPIQITRLNPMADRFEVEAEEMLMGVIDADPTERVIIIDANSFNINLETLHDSLFSTAAGSGDTVTCIINAGVIVGSMSASLPAFDVGTFAGGVTVNIEGDGRIEGCGGKGAEIVSHSPVAAVAGGTALYTRQAVNIDMALGEIWGGGGGGGLTVVGSATVGGGGGAGQLPGAGGLGAPSPFTGVTGTTTDGGTGGDGASVSGGDPGQAGVNGSILNGGAAGAAIDGDSYVTYVTSPDIQGTQIN